MKISVIVPVYNSGKILSGAYKGIKSELEKITGDYEIIFRNDASSDDSQQILKEISAGDKKVRILSNPANRGLGFTLRELFKDAAGDYIVYLDADAYLCFDLSRLDEFFKLIAADGGPDVLIASRYKRKDNRIPFYRRYPSKVYNIMNRMLFGMDIEDIGSGFVLFRKNTVKGLTLECEGFDIHSELFAKIRRAGFKIREEAVVYRHWYGGSFNPFKHAPKTLAGTLKAWFKVAVLNR